MVSFAERGQTQIEAPQGGPFSLSGKSHLLCPVGYSVVNQSIPAHVQTIDYRNSQVRFRTPLPVSFQSTCCEFDPG